MGLASQSMFALVLGGTILLGAACNQSQPTTSADPLPKQSQAAAIPSDAETWNIDTGASVIRWDASKVTGKHHGTIALQSGALLVKDGKPVGGSFTINMDSIVIEDLTDSKMNEMLSKHLRSDDFFSVANHPTATFVITNVQPVDGNRYTVSGELTIKGISKPVSFDATIDMQETMASAKGKATVDRTAYDIQFRSGKFFSDLGDKLIHDEFHVEFDLKAQQ